MTGMQEAWLAEISNRLESAGYERIDEELNGPFGNMRIRFRGAACEVVAGRDKLEWYVSISPRGGDPEMSPSIWACYLDGTEPDAKNSPTLESQLAFVYSRLGEVVEAVERDSEVGNKLLAINRKRVMARLRLGPDMKRLSLEVS